MQVLKANPINPRIEIRAYAGPMARDEAITFRKKWKTPPRILRTPVRNLDYTSSPVSRDVRLQDTEKGLERVGRDLAKQFKVGWNEYWPFLDTFTNISSQDGLQKLEAFLRRRYLESVHTSRNSTRSYCCAVQSHGEGAVSPISDLCLAFKACSLSDKVVQRIRPRVVVPASCGRCAGDVEEENTQVVPNPGLSPFLYVEKSCQVFAKRISDGMIGQNLSYAEVLRSEVRHLEDLMCSFKEDARFASVDFNLVHSRISALVAHKLRQAAEDFEQIMTGLEDVMSASREAETFSDDEDCLNMSYRKRQLMADQQKKADAEQRQVLE